MLQSKKLTLALLINAALVSTTFASEQSESKGFVEDANGSVLFRTGYLNRDKKDGLTNDTSSAAQTAIVKLDSGFTKGIVGFGAGIIGDASFKLGKNGHTGNQMIPTHSQDNADGTKDAYDHWARGGAYVKARVSNTTAKYGTQVSEIPVIASNTARLTPEYYTGLYIESNEIKDLTLIGGKFTKNQWSNDISSDQQGLDSAIFWGAKYKFNDQVNASYYGVDVKDKLDRHYGNVNYSFPTANGASVTLDAMGYNTKWKVGAETTDPRSETEELTNSIWGVSASYNRDAHNLMLAYQDNAGNIGYDYAYNADGLQSIYVPNSYLSDFNGNDEKSVGLQYNYNFKNHGLPGLNWTTAFVYGWDIDVAEINNPAQIIDQAEEHEFFNQVKYTVQSGAFKDASLRLRHSYLRASDTYNNAKENYVSNAIGSTNEWRIWLDIPVKLF
ncbi:OprD family outer membrane porin [Acinetobacter towneri]|uniref:OprD family outer membrane porin n=1 Tax=Acinetobacter towneri TaxID=202956 RepID=UPI001436A2E0|nr:OprD family outer membrane porin [Acinetobacter towneri]MCA4814764.1 outer membrane porin, OprD family [Acinetobacter towneri]MCO8059784.1 OprD family porin [Acinetobacter towneri]MCO8065509.1 OprD family porin [Acinetobacter towneri]MDD4853512.1 OprD family outer membrane porin [Acinetobacter towneri]QIV91452.1 OprD family porin [Acinetobacter towneri]